jgi:hypothetical protein
MPRIRHRIGPITVLLPVGYERPKLPWKREWLKALRSDKFKQALNCLCDGRGGYCCLGVLSLVQGRLIGTNDSDDSTRENALSYSNPCFPVLKGLGYFPEGVHVHVKGQKAKKMDCLAGVNDCGESGNGQYKHTANFKQIASLIHLLWKE